MGVPITGSFSMFGSGDNTTIAGAIVEGGANAGTVAATTDFNTLKGLADITRFNATYSEGATTLVDITKTNQFRGYPTATTTTTSTTTTTTTTAAVPSLLIYYKDIDLEGWPDSTTACAATAFDSASVYFNSPGPADWNEAFTGAYTVYGNAAKTITWAGVAGNRWYKSVLAGGAGVVFEITNGVINNLTSCIPATTTTTTTAAPTTTTTTTTTLAPCSITVYFNTAATPSPGGWDTQLEACQGTGTALTLYTVGSATCPTTFQEIFNDGKILYTNSALTTVLNGGDKFFKDASAPNTGTPIQIGPDGLIDTIGAPCGGTTTTSTTTTTTTTAAPTTTTSTTTTTTTTTTTAAPTTTTTTTAAPSDITLNLNSDTTSIGIVQLQYVRTNNANATTTLSDTDPNAPANLTTTVSNAKPSSTMTASVTKFSSGTTVEVGTGSGVPRVQLVVIVNNVDIFNETLDTGPLTLAHSFTYNSGDIVEVNGEITSV